MPVRYILSSVWVRLSILSPLSIVLYVGLYVFSLPISLMMIERIYILCLVIIIKSEVWTITNYLGLGHETTVSAVCLSIFLFDQPCHNLSVCEVNPKDIAVNSSAPVMTSPESWSMPLIRCTLLIQICPSCWWRHGIHSLIPFRDPFCWHDLTLIPAETTIHIVVLNPWMDKHMPSRIWDEIIYPFPNFTYY